MTQYPKRLIEVDLPIKKISEHARREKSIRHGHISTLHIWWARRPLAACRAVICAALWPDPGDPNCPERFKTEAARIMKAFRDKRGGKQWNWIDGIEIRQALLDFIADFANWDNSTVKDYLETSRALTQIAHESLGGEPGTRPLVVDPFAGGGSIPLEALRVGADAFASDLNPVAVLLNKVVLEYIPKYGQRLTDEVRKWGEWIKKEAEKELSEFYPKDPDGATPIAYLWARTIKCEGPGCGSEVPLMRSLWLAKKESRSIALQIIPDHKNKRVEFKIIENAKVKDVAEGTVRRGSATCPVCGYTTHVASVRQQLKVRRGGADDARLFAVVTTRAGQQGRFYRLPTERDLKAIKKAAEELEKRKREHKGALCLVPDEPTPQGGGSGAGRAFSQRNYGMDRFEDLFTPRQALALTTLTRLVGKIDCHPEFEMPKQVRLDNKTYKECHSRASGNPENDRAAMDSCFRRNGHTDKVFCDGNDFAKAVQTCLALAISKSSDLNNALCTWRATSQCVDHLFARQAIPITWDFAEAVLTCDCTGSWESMYNRSSDGLESVILKDMFNSHVEQISAMSHPFPNSAAQYFVTDPPYYDAIPYADLSDFFIVWLKRTVGDYYKGLFQEGLSPKDEECIVDEVKGKDKSFFERSMAKAMSEGRRIITPSGIGIVVFAHKTTTGWEAQLQAMVDAGWVITSSWPIDTEMGSRLRAMDSAALASSVHLVCRPRENLYGSLRTEEIGDWRDVLAELPRRIHDWMPRLAKEGIVGADAIFACLGPALEIFSRYSKVEKASGDVVTLKEYLEHVWAVVAKEALNMIFEGADTSGFEEDARLTAMWLWTLSTAKNGNGNGKQSRLVPDDAEEMHEDEEEYQKSGKANLSGYFLEYDAARKIAQGLGAHLERLQTLVEIKGDKARLIPIDERTKALFGKADADATVKKRKKKLPQKQFDFMKEFEEVEKSSTLGEKHITQLGNTTLDRLHQTMILFAAGRGEALKRFLVEEGVGRDERFWRLAQAFSALYPKNSDEKRWVDGVMARKKGLGF